MDSDVSAVRLKPFGREDFDRLIQWIRTKRELVQWGNWKFQVPLDPVQLTEYLADEEISLPFRAVEVATGKVVGHVELFRLDLKAGTARLCRVLIGDPAMRGKGLGKAMVRKAMEIAFVRECLRRVDLRVYDFNQAAVKCYEGIGFVETGRSRNSKPVDGEYWMGIDMSLTAESWRRLQQVSRPLPSQGSS